MKHHPAQQDALFAAALSRPLAERGVFLARDCGADLDRLAHLVALMAAHEDPDDVPESAPPPQDVAPSYEPWRDPLFIIHFEHDPRPGGALAGFPRASQLHPRSLRLHRR